MIRTYTALLLVCLYAEAWGQQPSQIGASFPRFTMAEGQEDKDGLPTSGAKLCALGRPDVCYLMPSHADPGSGKVIYEFGLDPRSERLPLRGGGSWVFFSATFSGGGSGTLERVAVLRFDQRDQRIINLMPYVAVTNAGHRAMWTIPGVSEFPILVLADFIWGEGETHYSDHFYQVEAWCFDPKLDQYKKVLSYKTDRKYNSETARVLVDERQEIRRRLGAK
jgi:hypothetical protein